MAAVDPVAELRTRAGVKDDETQSRHKSLPVMGYTDQPQEKVDLVNVNKQAEEKLLRGLDMCRADPTIDQELLQHGRMQLQAAFMTINRAIFKPQRIALPEDAAK